MHSLMWPDVARFGAATGVVCACAWLGYRIGNQYGRGRRRALAAMLVVAVVAWYVWQWTQLLHPMQAVLGCVLTLASSALAFLWRRAEVQQRWHPGGWGERDAAQERRVAQAAERERRRMPRLMLVAGAVWAAVWAPLVWCEMTPSRPVSSPVDVELDAALALLGRPDLDAAVQESLALLGSVRLESHARQDNRAVDAVHALMLALDEQSGRARVMAKRALRAWGHGQYDAVAWAALGIAWAADLDRPEARFASLHKACALDPPPEVDAWARLALAMRARWLGQHDQAIVELDRVNELASSPLLKSKALVHRGLLLCRQRDAGQGMLDLNEALTLAPDEDARAYALVARGAAHMVLSDRSAAMADLDWAVELALDPSTLGWAYENRARLWAELGYDDRVRADLLKAKALGYEVPHDMKEYLR